MKRIVIALSLAASVIGAANAQSFRIGLRGGINVANMYGDLVPVSSITNATDTKNITGLQGAVVAELKFGPFSIVPELAYSQQGINVYGTTFKTDNFNIPVLLRYSLGFSKIRVYGNTGPQFGLKLNKDDVTKIVPSTNGTGQNLTVVMSYVKTSDFSWLVGAGAGIEIGPGELFVDARYVLTFSPSVQIGVIDAIQNGQNATPTFSPGLRAGTVALSIGYAYKFGL